MISVVILESHQQANSFQDRMEINTNFTNKTPRMLPMKYDVGYLFGRIDVEIC